MKYHQILFKTRCGCTKTMFVHDLLPEIRLPLKLTPVNIFGVGTVDALTSMKLYRVFKYVGTENGMYLYEEVDDE